MTDLEFVKQKGTERIDTYIAKGAEYWQVRITYIVGRESREYDPFDFMMLVRDIYFNKVDATKGKVDKYDTVLWAELAMQRIAENIDDAVRKVNGPVKKPDFSKCFAGLELTKKVLRESCENAKLKRDVSPFKDIKWWVGIITGAATALASVYFTGGK